MTDTLDRAVPVATRTAELRDLAADALRRCGADPDALPGTGRVDVVSPVTGQTVAMVPFADAGDVERAIDRAHAAFLAWRTVPAPARGRLVKRFGEHVVLSGVDLAVAEHEVVVLIGASGSGKSTLLRCVSLLEELDDGTVRLADYVNLRAARRQQAGGVL